MYVKHNGWKSLMALLLVAVLATIGAPPAHAKSPLVTGVQVAGGAGKLKVHVAATGEVQYRVLSITDPRYSMVVEIFPAQLETSVKKTVDVNSGLVERVRVGQFSDNPDVVRLVVDLKSPTQYQIVMAPGRKGLTVAVNSGEVATAKVARADVPPAPRASTSVAAPEVPTYVVHGTPKQIAAGPHQRGYKAKAGSRRYSGHSVGRRVSIDFVGADLIYVLKILAKEMDCNLVADQTVKGTVTMTLKDVPATGALTMILKISGFDSKIVDHTIIVGSKETLEKIPDDIFSSNRAAGLTGPKVILPIPLEHAKAATVADTIKSVYPDVKVTVQADQNFVVVTGPKPMVRDIKEFVQKLDVPPPPPVVLKTEIIPIKYATSQTTLGLVKALFPNLNYSLEDRLNALIVTGQDRDIESMKAFLATVDIPLQQVMLDIKVVDLNEAGSKSIGMAWGNKNSGTGVFGGEAGPLLFTEDLGTDSVGAAKASTGSLAIGPFNRIPFVISATLNLLISTTDAKVISSPRVMTQSGKEASVMIGDKFPIVYFDPRAGQFQVQYVDIGVKLVVKPTVSSDGYVMMELSPDVSVLKGLVNNQYPQTGNTTVKTNVRVKDGDTVVIGGLLRETETMNIQKIPLLGDLPILGEFFRNTSVNRTKSEVFIMVSPKISQ